MFSLSTFLTYIYLTCRSIHTKNFIEKSCVYVYQSIALICSYKHRDSGLFHQTSFYVYRNVFSIFFSNFNELLMVALVLVQHTESCRSKGRNNLCVYRFLCACIQHRRCRYKENHYYDTKQNLVI